MPASTRASSAEYPGPAHLWVGAFRAAGRIALLGGWTAFSLVALWPVLLRPGRRAAAKRDALHTWARGVARILGLRISVDGAPPTGTFLLVTNHLGYLDVITLASRVRAGFVAKREVRRWPVWGHLAALVGTVFIDRTRRRDAARVVASMAGHLAEGRSLIVFPEGTSTDGDGVAPFRPALLESAVASGAPVYCASLSYRTDPGDPPAETAVCWWGDMAFGPHILGLLRLRAIHAHLRFGTEGVHAKDRKRLAEALHGKVVELIGKGSEGRAGRDRREGAAGAAGHQPSPRSTLTTTTRDEHERIEPTLR